MDYKEDIPSSVASYAPKIYEQSICTTTTRHDLSEMNVHLDFFREKMCDISDEHGEQFHQEISEMESRYKEKPSSALLADFSDIEQNRIAVTMILGKIDEDPHSSSCPGISYIDILGPVASAYPTGSPYAMVSNNFGNTATSIMPSSHSGCSPCPDTLSSHFSTIINNTPATPIIQGSCSLNNEDPDYYDEKLELQPYQSLSSIETIRNILRLSGFSQSGIHSISTAIETICRYRLVNYSTSKSNTTGSRNNITLYDSFPLYGSHNNEENTSTNPLEFLIASYLKDSLSINNDFYYSGSSDTECITRNLMVSKEKMSCLTSMDAFLIKEITMKTITEIKVHSDESLHNESSITLQIMGLDLDNVLEAIGMIIYSPLDPRLSETDLTV